MSECIVGQGQILEGTVGIKLQEASTSGLGGEDVSVQTVEQNGCIFYVEALVEGGAAQVSHRVREEDVLETVDGLPLKDLTLAEAEGLLMGEIGSQITIKGRRGLCGSEYIVTLTSTQGGGAVDLAAAACSRAAQMRHDLSMLQGLLDIDLGTRKQFRSWRLHTVSRKHHHGLLRCILRRRHRSHMHHDGILILIYELLWCCL
jgi:hypothetical protein